MRSLIFILLVSVVAAVPSSECFDDFRKCTVEDFDLDTDAPKQCVPYAYDLENPTGPFGANVGNREQCAFWDWCIPNGYEYHEKTGGKWTHKLKIAGREFTSGSKCGDGADKECVELIVDAYAYTEDDGDTTTTTTITPAVDDAVLIAAINYYNNQDYCRISWIGIVFWVVSIVAGVFITYWVIEALRLMLFNSTSTIFGQAFAYTTLWGDQRAKNNYARVAVRGRRKRDLV